MASGQAVRAFRERARGAAQMHVLRVRIRCAEQNDERTLQHVLERRFIDGRAAKAIRKIDGGIGHRPPAGVGGDGLRHARIRHEVKKTVHELRAGRVAEQIIALAVISGGGFHRVENRFDVAEGPLLAGPRIPLLIRRPADAVAVAAGKGRFRELWRHQDEAVLPRVRRPLVAVAVRVTIDAVHHDEDRCVRIRIFGQIAPHRNRLIRPLKLEAPSA